MDLVGAARRALGRVFTCHSHVTVRAIPDRDAMAPPQLPTDAPILDVLEPVEVGLLETFRHDSDTSIFHGSKSSMCQRLDLDEPLCGDHWFNDLSPALGARDRRAIWFRLDHESSSFHICPHIFARLEAILTLIGSAVFIDLCLC